MVATARGRKTAGASEHETHQNPVRTPDGRRHIFGLSQAIREKAFQSTSPSSEAKHVQSPHFSQASNHTANHQAAPQHPQKKSEGLTIEERLRNLLNSDTEGPDDKKAQKVQPPTRYRSKTPGPFAQSPPQKQLDMNRPGGEAHSGRLVQRLPNGEYVLVNRGLSHQANPAASNNGRSNLAHSQPRRCTSAVPSSFHQDENWNKVLDHKPHPVAQSRVANGLSPGNNRQHHITSPNQSPNGPVVHPGRPSQSAGKLRDQQRLAPALRRSLCFENENTEPHMVFSPDPNSQALSMRLAAPTNQQHMYNVPQPQHSTPTPAHPLHRQARSYENVTSGVRHDHAGYKGTSPNASDQHHSPSKSPNHRQEAITRSPNTKSSPVRHNATGDVIAAHKMGVARGHYPQQNFSFRRAVHHSVSSESVSGPNGGTKRSPLSADKQPPGDDRDTRKSDDRDSGTVLEPEASVFDFDSSVLSEEPEVCSPTRTDQSPPKEAWSRSSTPLLPPLSFPEEDDVPARDEEEVAEVALEAKAIAEQHFAKPSMAPANLRRAKSDSRVKDLQSRNPPISPPVGGAEELSPTESALSDVKAKHLELKNQSKVVSSKLQRGASAIRRGFHPKNLSGDERSRVSKKHRQRRRYDDSDATDWSQQQESYRITDRSRQSAYYRHSSVTIDASEIGETSSVRSITTTSVCSGALRKSARRRRSGVGGVDRYSREIRSVNKRFTRLEAHVVTLARSLAQLSSELRHQSVTSREIDQLRQQVQEIKTNQQSAVEHRRTQPQIILKSEGKQPKLSSKLAKFFGEQPPLIHLFLKQLGYEKYIKNFECERIGMMELPYMDEKRLHDIGIPLGPRLRILKEAQKSSYV